LISQYPASKVLTKVSWATYFSSLEKDQTTQNRRQILALCNI